MFPVSVCMIVKNEENKIERCLSSLAPFGFEIIVVDTGSSDRTKEAASPYADKIADFEWADDFSAARNYSISLASNDWIFIIDGDEAVETIDVEELDYFMKNLSGAVGSVNRINDSGSPDGADYYTDRTERFFDRRRYRYTGRIHEQLVPSDGLPFDSFLLKTTLYHDGYAMTQEQRQKKAKRNISLLLLQLKEEPDNPYVYYQLGKGYEMIGQDGSACEYYRSGMAFNPDPSLAYVQSMVLAYGYCLLRTGAVKEALLFGNIQELFPDSADFCYLMGLIYRKNGYLENALEEFQKAVSFDFSNENGANSFLSWFQMGEILALTGDKETAAQCYGMCEDYPPAKDALFRLSLS